MPNLALVYRGVKKPYFIVGAVYTSREYVTDSEGKAYVPSGVYLQPVDGRYEVTIRGQGLTTKEMVNADVIWVEFREYDRRRKPPVKMPPEE